MRAYYLLAAVIGTIAPYYFFGAFAAENGLDARLFIEQVLAARASLGLVADLLISSLVFWPFVFREAKRLDLARPWAYVVLTLGVGLSCALPLFLYFRDKRGAMAAARA